MVVNTTTTHDITELENLLQRTRDGLGGLKTQIETLDARIESHEQGLRDADQQEEEARRRLHESEEAKTAAEKAVEQARIALKLNEGLTREASAIAAKTEADYALSRAETNITTARTELSKLEKRLERECGSLRERIAKDTLQRQALELQVSELEIIEKRTHSELGQARFESLFGYMDDVQETVTTLSDITKEHRDELRAAQERAPRDLAEWPELAKKAQRRIDQTLPVEEPALVQLARMKIKLLKLLQAEGPFVEAVRHRSLQQVHQLLSISPDAYARARQPGFSEVVEREVAMLEDLIHQSEQQIAERLRSVERYGY